MNNQTFGILTVIFCLVGYFYSWKYQSKENYKVAVLLLLVCGLALRIYSSTDFFLHNWDERYHALVSKNLMGHMLVPALYDHPVLPYEIKNWAGNHIWLHKQPLPLWTMAISMMVFGVNEIALRLPSIIFTTAGIALTYSIAAYFFNKRTAYLAAFFYSINGLIVEMTGGRVATDHIDIYFLFFIELSVFFTIVYVQKKKMVFNILVGIFMGAAILCKWLPALIVLPIWYLIVLDTKEQKLINMFCGLFIIVLTAVIIVLPWQLYIYQVFPDEAKIEAAFNVRHFTEVLEEQGGPFYYFLEKLRINYGELIYLPLLWLLWHVYKKTNWKYAALAVWIVVPILVFSCALTKMQAYILFISPALFMITAEFWYWLYNYREGNKFKWLYNLILILMIALPVRYCIERMKPFERTERRPQWVVDLKLLDKKKIENGILFNYDRPIEAMFFTDLTAYAELPSQSDLIKLQEEGYSIFINDNLKVPVEIRNIRGINFAHLTAPPEK